jgi:hypothetical protein
VARGLCFFRNGHPTRLARGGAGLAALLVVALTVLSVVPEWHACLHADAADHHGNAGHHCVVNDFAAGGAWFAAPAPTPVPARTAIGEASAADRSVILALMEHRLLPACGPPANLPA